MLIDYRRKVGMNLSVFGDTYDNIKVIGTSLIFHGISCEFAVGSIFVTVISVSIYVFLQSLGFDAGSSNFISAVRVFIWPILYFPFELIIALGSAGVASFNICCGVLPLRLLRTYCHEMR